MYRRRSLILCHTTLTISLLGFGMTLTRDAVSGSNGQPWTRFPVQFQTLQPEPCCESYVCRFAEEQKARRPPGETAGNGAGDWTGGEVSQQLKNSAALGQFPIKRSKFSWLIQPIAAATISFV